MADNNVNKKMKKVTGRKVVASTLLIIILCQIPAYSFMSVNNRKKADDSLKWYAAEDVENAAKVAKQDTAAEAGSTETAARAVEDSIVKYDLDDYNVPKEASEQIKLAEATKESGKADIEEKGSDINVIYDEAYYVTLDHYGNIRDASIVKTYDTYNQDFIVDFGDYTSIRNLSDTTKPFMVEGAYCFELAEDVPKQFNIEAKTTEPYKKLPWDISLHYKYNGVLCDVEDIVGKPGVVDIEIDLTPNKNAPKYLQNNYTALTALAFNQNSIQSLEAPGAQVQLLGNIRTAIFVALPGEKQHLTVRVGTQAFKFGGVVFTMVPMTLGQLSEIQALGEDKVKIEDNYRKMSKRVDSVLDAIDDISYGAEGLVESMDGLQQSAGDMVSVADPMTEDLAALSLMVEDTLGLADPMLQDIVSLKVDLRRLGDTIDYIQSDSADTADALYRLKSVSSSLQECANLLNIGNGLNKISVKNLDINKKLAFLMHELYSRSIDSGDISSSVSFIGFIKDFLAERGYSEEEIADVPEEIRDIYEMYFEGVDVLPADEDEIILADDENIEESFLAEEESEDPAQYKENCELPLEDIDAIIGMTEDDIKAAINSIIDSIFGPPRRLLSSLAGLTGDLRSLEYLLQDVESLGTVGQTAIVEKGQLILEELDVLDEIVNVYAPAAENLTVDLVGASTVVANSAYDLQGMLASLSYITKRAIRTDEERQATRDSKNEVSKIIEDIWTDYTGKKNNILNVDTTATIESLTDSRNLPPKSVQIIIRTQEIDDSLLKKAEKAPETAVKEKGVFDKLVDWLKNLFHIGG